MTPDAGKPHPATGPCPFTKGEHHYGTVEQIVTVRPDDTPVRTTWTACRNCGARA